MPSRALVALFCLTLTVHQSAVVATAAGFTLRSAGAKGDGKTDDRAAIEAALIKANGAPVDGEGATYAVHGNIELKCDVDLRNATLVEVMKAVDISKFIPSASGNSKPTVEPADALRLMIGSLPLLHHSGVATYAEDLELTPEDQEAVLPSIDIRTLAITGTKDKPIAVHLENVKVERGDQPESGNHSGGGIIVFFASPVTMKNVEVTGDGKGSGIHIQDSAKVKLEKLYIHDMIWAPYRGDNIFETTPLQSIKEDFGWNNFPIYQYDAKRNRFVRVRIQEQVSGLHVRDCEDVELLDSKIERLQTKIDGKLYALQADGTTMASIKNLKIHDCHFANVWEGIDFTAQSGENFLFEDNTATDTFTFGFKLAHPKHDGKMINCTSYRAGNAGFIMEPEMENIEFIKCHAVETGANGYWTKADGSRLMTTGGFRLDTRSGLPTPLRIKFDGCSATNTNHPSTMDYGFICEGGIDPADRHIIATDCTAEGAKVKAIQGIVTK